MDWDSIDWPALQRLRSAFLEGSAGARDYWLSERDLASYDQTFAQRIGWKWDSVLNELKLRRWDPPAGLLLDWGCGSGVASRAFLDHFGTNKTSALHLWDRSLLAVRFAARRARERFPELTVETGTPASEEIAVLLLSHVLTELNEHSCDELLTLAGRATTVLWVEPGTFESSRRLLAVREHLRGTFHVVSPCPHQGACGLLTRENASHWCHQFASPPPSIFTDGQWARFATLAGIDLRSLPMSYLVLDKRPVTPFPANTARIIGRPQVYKAHALLFGCQSEGVRERKLTKRAFPEQFRQLRKGALPELQGWDGAGTDITGLADIHFAPATPNPTS